MRCSKRNMLIIILTSTIVMLSGCVKEVDGYTKVAMGYYQEIIDILGDCETELNNLYVMHWEGADDDYVEFIPGYYYIYEIYATYPGEPRTTITVIMGDDDAHVYSESDYTGSFGDNFKQLAYYTAILGYSDYQEADQFIEDTASPATEYGIINVDKDYVEQNFGNFDTNNLYDLNAYMYE